MLASVALFVTGLWGAAASALDGLFAGLDEGWTRGAERFGRGAPRPVGASLRPIAGLSRIAGRAAGAVRRLTGAHRRLAERVDARLLRHAA